MYKNLNSLRYPQHEATCQVGGRRASAFLGGFRGSGFGAEGSAFKALDVRLSRNERALREASGYP